MKIPIQPSSMYPAMDYLKREELENLQLRKLKYQLEYVYHNSVFYRRLFDEHKVSPESIKTRDDLRRLPFLTKSILLEDQQANPPFGTRLCVPETKLVQSILTSGTSGLGQEVYGLTRMDFEYAGSAWARWFYVSGIRKGDRIVLTWPLGANSGPQAAFQGALKLGANVFPLAIYDTKAKLQMYMLRFKPHCIVATPSYLTQLTVLMQEMGLDPKQEFPEIKAINIGTEAYPIAWAEKMEEFWGARVHELYGSTQQGAMAGTNCEKGCIPDGKRGIIHLDEHGTFYEVLNPDTDEPVKPGEEGELVLTNLHREGSPLVRFRSADRVTLMSHADCDCGRPFNGLLSGTIARYDDMIKIKSQNIWPEAVDSLVFAVEEIEEYNGRVIVDERGREEVILSIEFKNQPLTDESKRQRLGVLAENLRRQIGVSMTLREVPQGSLERFIFKTRRWTDERKKGLERVKYVTSGTTQEKGN